MIRARRIIGPPRRAPGSGDSAPGEQRLEDADRHRRLGFGIEIGFDRDSLEEAGDEGDEKPRAETGVEPRTTPRPPAFAASISRSSPREHFGVDRPRHRGDARIAAGLGPDLDDQPRFLRRLGEHMLAQAASHRLHDVAVVRHQLGESPGPLGLIELAQALDDRLFGREIAVEIAGAHAGFVGDMLHRRGVKAVADKGALGRLAGFARAARRRRAGVRWRPRSATWGAHENECSFSWNAANVASE